MDVIDYDKDDRVALTLDESVFYGKIEDKPEMEQRLFKEQKDFYNAKTEEERLQVWREMFSNIQIYARSMVLQKLKNKTFLEPEEVDAKATSAALNFMEQYLTRVNFHVGASFGSMINFKVLEAVYGSAKDDKVASLNVSDSDDESLDLLSMQKKADISLLWENDYDDPEDFVENSSVDDIVNEFLQEADSEIKSDALKLKCRFFLLLLIKKPRNYHIKDTFIKMNCKSKKEIDLMHLIEMHLYDRLKLISMK